jgi:lipoate-protein ligase A
MKVVEKIPNGKLVVMDATFSDGMITHMKITGDFFLHPEDTIENIEKAFVGNSVSISDDELSVKLQRVLKDAVLIGVTVEDLVRLFKKAVTA